MKNTTESTISLEEVQNFKGAYPKQLIHLSLVEMWERFCFYGMRGVLAFFMVDQLHLTDQKSNLQYGAIQAFVYAFTFIGGIFADKILGFRKSLFWGGFLMIIGNLILAFSPQDLFYIGITLSIIGTGFFKPNISSMVGELYHQNDARRDAGYNFFYMAINVGGLAGGALCIYLGKFYSWHLCFLSAAFVMTIGLITFFFTKKHLGPIGESPLQNLEKAKRSLREIAVYIGSVVCIPLIYVMVKTPNYADYFMYTIGVVALVYFIYKTIEIRERKAQHKLLAAFVLIFGYFVFMAISEQSGGSLSLFAKDNLNDILLGIHIDPNVINNSVNSFFVIVFSFVMGFLWIMLAKRKIEPNTIIKFGFGFLLLALSFYTFYETRLFATADGKSSLNIFTLAYLFLTLGELCIGPIGMSGMTKLAPKSMFGTMMGLWFLSSAFGQLVAGKLGASMSSVDNASLMSKLMSYTDGYKTLAIYSLVAGLALIIISPIIKRLMGEVR